MAQNPPDNPPSQQTTIVRQFIHYVPPNNTDQHANIDPAPRQQVYGPNLEPRPASDAWLRGGGWTGTLTPYLYPDSYLSLPSLLDGGVDPPQRYFSQEEIDSNRCHHWARIQALHEADRQVCLSLYIPCLLVNLPQLNTDTKLYFFYSGYSSSDPKSSPTEQHARPGTRLRLR